ncbi:phosphoadenosine phosphosulfate reductase [Ruegeria sp. 2012CJ41-6]|uniref:Phosphoadenosine phosphosulfate reductase n=1 Tax=Ruegeria spongiae TaxID=2942209 RepID=A0ABT0Q4B9_9RHOB|nr:phosphoadenosine phosphosulfate reductase [Ruegeria spongiae]MCL6284709.1 phosphoadenosine phosphosulfate reductase [Ruegeria spongiae]
MKDIESALDQPLVNLRPRLWKARLLDQARAEGEAHELGEQHFATFIPRSPTLLVSFETMQDIRALSDSQQPLGFEMIRKRSWSHLCLISNGDTWFRDDAVYAFFDRLIDDGIFEAYDKVVFYGAGSCGYAAAAFSVAAPGASVIAVQPQATLDPRMTEWDDRFTSMRRTAFDDRFGYAPDMLDAADQAFVLYDPGQQLDAMHATLFARPNVTRLRMRHMGSDLQARLSEMKLLSRLLTKAAENTLTEIEFYRMFRARRASPHYLRMLRNILEHQERPYLEMLLCRNTIARLPMRRLRRRLERLQQLAAEGVFRPPPDRST